MAEFINKRRKNVSSLGDTDITDSSSLNERLARLAEMKKSEHTEAELKDASKEQASLEAANSLETINRIIGDPQNEFVPRDKMDFAPEEWDCFPKATEEAVGRMSASIQKYGLLHRVTVWRRPNGRYTILGGHTRTTCYDYLYKATKEDRYKYVPCLVYESEQLSEVDAHRIFLLSNTDQRAMPTSILTRAYCNLVELEKKQSFYGSGIYARTAAAKQANVSATAFGRYLKLRDLIPELMNAVDRRVLPVKSAYCLSFLKKDLQTYIFKKNYYEDLPVRTAKRLQDEVAHKGDIDHIIKEEQAGQVFRYTVEMKTEKPADYHIAPLILPKDEEMKDKIISTLTSSIDKLDLPQEIKEVLLNGIRQG